MLLDLVRASLNLGAAFSFTHGDSPVSFMCAEHDNQSLPVMWARFIQAGVVESRGSPGACD